MRKLPGFVSVALAATMAAACGDDSASGGGGAGGGEATGGAGGGADIGSVDFQAEVVRYELAADVSALSATTTLVLEVEAPGGNCYSIGSEILPQSVAIDDQPAREFELLDTALAACGSSLLDAGEHALSATLALEEKTHHDLDVGLSKRTDLSGATFTYLLSWVGGCDHFGPCDDDPSRLVHFTYDVAHPRGTTVLCPGTLIPGDTSTRCELLGTRAPTYSAFAWMADPAWQKQELLSAAGVDVVFYEVPGGGLASAIDGSSLGEFLEWSTDRFGPLPYGPELRFAGAPTAWLGFEHPANVVLQEELDTLSLSYDNGLMHVTMHEIVHQWAGDATTLATPQDFAWKEAIAEYVSYVFEDESRPVGEAASSLAYWDAVSLQAAYHIRPMDEPAPAVPDFYGDVYGPGPMVLFVQLEDMLGRDVILEAIAAFLEGGGARSVADLQAALEAASGEDLEAYFSGWVFGTGAPVWPTFSVSTMDAGNGNVTVVVTQTQPGEVLPCRVEVGLQGATATGLAVVEFGLNASASMAEVTLPFAEPVVTTTIDPGHRVVNDSPGAARVKLPVYIF